MAKIIVFGDIDIFPLYLSVNGGKEVAVSGKCPQSFTVPAGTNHVFATTVTKIERVGNRFSDGGFVSTLTSAIQDGTNTTLSGELDFAENEVLLIEVQQKGLKTVVYNKLVPEDEVNNYVNTYEVQDYGTKKRGKKMKGCGCALLLLLIGLVLLFLWVFTAKAGV